MTKLSNKVQDAINKLVQAIIEDCKQEKEQYRHQCKYAVIETLSSNSTIFSNIVWVVGKDKIGLMKEANRRYKQIYGKNPDKRYLTIKSVPENEKLIEKLIPALINFDNGFENGWETVLISSKDWSSCSR
jgi:hypothetical protein